MLSSDCCVRVSSCAISHLRLQKALSDPLSCLLATSWYWQKYALLPHCVHAFVPGGSHRYCSLRMCPLRHSLWFEQYARSCSFPLEGLILPGQPTVWHLSISNALVLLQCMQHHRPLSSRTVFSVGDGFAQRFTIGLRTPVLPFGFAFACALLSAAIRVLCTANLA